MDADWADGIPCAAPGERCCCSKNNARRVVPSVAHAYIARVTSFLSRLQWINIAAFVVPAVLMIWLDRRAGRRP